MKGLRNCRAFKDQICLLLACNNAGVSTKTTYTLAPLRIGTRLSTILLQRYALSVDQYAGVCNSKGTADTRICPTHRRRNTSRATERWYRNDALLRVCPTTTTSRHMHQFE